jgi:hypothetical protein
MERVYQAQLGQAQSQQQAQNQQPSQEEADSLRLSSVRQLINEEIFVQRAAKMNLTATPEEVDAKVAEMKAPFPTLSATFAAHSPSTSCSIKRSSRRSTSPTPMSPGISNSTRLSLT